MPDYITTYSGIHFIPVEPDADKIYIRDIAHALSLICRGNGHVKTFFSVGQHCINCALEAEAGGYSERMILACLLHDAGEAYLSDVPSPLKKYLREYNAFEDKILDVIYEKYLGSTLTEAERLMVKKVDKDMLYYDLRELLGEVPDGPEPEIQIELSYKMRPFEEVEQQYLEIFQKYVIIPE